MKLGMLVAADSGNLCMSLGPYSSFTFGLVSILILRVCFPLFMQVLSESTQDSSSSSIVKPLANASVISIMSNVETGTGIENLGLGMGLVGDESVLDRCKSRSTNDLSDVSKTAISWDQTGKGPSGEAPIVDEPDQTDSEEAPAIQDENKDALVITAGESQGMRALYMSL